MKTYCLNIKTNSLSTYTNFPFNSYAEINGMLIGANESGLYVLNGLTDNGMYINSKICLPTIDLHSRTIQRLSHFWLDGAGDMFVTVRDDREYEFMYYPDRIEPQSYRIKIGKGFRGRYVTVEFSNNLGDSFSIKTITIFTDRQEEGRR